MYADAVLDSVESSSGETISFLQDIIRKASLNPPGLEKECADVIARKMKEIGLEVKMIEAVPGRPNVIGILPGKGQGPKLLYNGHMDVVPIGEPKDWAFDPFGAEIREGYVRKRFLRHERWARIHDHEHTRIEARGKFEGRSDHHRGC